MKNDAELTYDPELHPQILDGVRQRAVELSNVLGDEIAVVDEARRAWRRPLAIAALALLVASLLILGTTFWSAGIPFRSRAANTTFSLGLVALGTLAVVNRWSAIRRRSLVASRELRSALMPPLRALVRLIISELQGDDVRWSGTLHTSKAPALVELNLQDTIPSLTYERLRTFICGHESSATGLAGARGSGKTTLMRQLRLDEALDCHVALVSAPVQYSAVEFTRLIHSELAQVGLKPGEAGLIRNRMAAPALRAVLRTLLGSVVVLLLVTLWIYDKNRPTPNSFNLGWTGFTAVVLGALIVGFVISRQWALFQSRAKLMVSPQTTRELCLQQLEFLRWSTTVERSASTAVKVSGSGFEGGSKLSRTEREVTHAESVQALRQFVDQLLALSNKPVVICVDELDKLANPAEAVDAINGLKDLFHVAKAHFVLSVSTDAMHSFAARGVPVRDVFDSAFDTIISVGPLSLEESQTLISRRARDFSKVFVLFCHAWSGGHARDLIRTARSCVDLKRELKGDEEATITLLSRRVLRKDLREVVDATVEKLRGEGDELTKAMLDRVLAFQESLEDEVPSLYDLVEASEFPPDTGTVAAEAQPAATLASYARIAGLCERLFSVARQPAAWQTEAMSKAVTALAGARSSLGRHPREIERRLKRAADACAVVEASAVTAVPART
ncbi:P-loop NTPase fold protein [Nonomuraea sp. SYSU D8015]|uniref:P-loop NTPase fold protein n=1 Tax=Nonomuraea sp. SYSU D8015 TaxID=2593644 RepID=UPI0016608F6B|nr:P-loop NTPase fold protein [Nonomuraea sp. SYSU D8015]